MDRVVKLVARPPKLENLKRVAAYARVSCGKDAMLNSLSQQVSYYSDYIQKHDDWEYVGVYADEAETGTKADRDNFQLLLNECRAGRVDMIITKSISRFARNTVTLLETVRELKMLKVDVFFQEQNIHSLSGEGELMLSILASFAQEESRSVSENQKWRIRHAFEKGELMNWRFMFGYTITRGKIEINPEEAEIVREIFRRVIQGESFNAICSDLNERGIRGIRDGEWSGAHLREFLNNEKYTGNAMLQKCFRNNHLEKKELRNNGELPKYYATETHPAIISQEDYDAVQTILRTIDAKIAHRKRPEKSIFTGMILCPHCGKNYKHVTSNGSSGWNCQTYQMRGKQYCRGKKIPDSTLEKATASVLGSDSFDPAAFSAMVDHIEVPKDNVLVFHFKDGHLQECVWEDRSRSLSWTPEMKEKARADARRRKHG